jgi:hypothetical protein
MTGMTFVGYFYPVRDLVFELATFSTGKWQMLWICFSPSRPTECGLDARAGVQVHVPLRALPVGDV